jgi:hypothetical protein
MQKYVTANDLDEMRDDPTYKNVPTRAQLKELLAAKSEPGVDSMAATKVASFRQNQAEKQDLETSSDPLEQPLEILERWTEDRVIVTLQRKICLRNDENENDEIPLRSCAFIDVLNAFFGLGIGALLKGEQSLQTGVVNKWLDSLDLTLSPSFHRKKGVGPSAQNIGVAPGKVVNDDGELAPLAVQSVTAEALQAIQISESRGRRRVGANFGPDMPTQAMRTAEGVNEFTAGIQVRTQYFIELFAEMVSSRRSKRSSPSVKTTSLRSKSTRSSRKKTPRTSKRDSATTTYRFTTAATKSKCSPAPSSLRSVRWFRSCRPSCSCSAPLRLSSHSLSKTRKWTWPSSWSR